MQVIDFHSHFFARPFFEALAELSPFDDPFAVIREKTPIEVPHIDVGRHLQRWIEELDAHDVERMVTFASLPREIPAVAEAARASLGRITPIAMVNPLSGGDIGPLLAAQGFKGVLVFPAMHHFHIAEQGEFWAVFRQCLSGLPTPAGHAYLLREMDQLSSAKVCKVLGISENNLWTRLHRARMLLRRCLEDNWFSEGSKRSDS